MDGLSEKINEILADHADNIRRYKEEEEKIIGKLRFCSEHNLDEEHRILMVKHNAMGLLLYNYKEMFGQIQKALDDWNS